MALSSIWLPVVAGAGAHLATDLDSSVHTLQVTEATPLSASSSSIRVPLASGGEASLATWLVGGVHTLRVTNG